MRYLLVTHIPFARDRDGSILIDRLWAEDLQGLADAMGTVTVAAPEIRDPERLCSWGPGVERLSARDTLRFHSLPERRGRLDVVRRPQLRAALRKAVTQADLVHTSNLFEPDTDLYFGHDLAVRLGKKTLFVVAEDFVDMLGWEWVRPAPGRIARLRRQRALARMDRHVRQRVRNATLTLLHTPAAVARYRLDAANAFPIRQPVHETADVITATELSERCGRLQAGQPLTVAVASRLAPLKGIGLLLRSIALLRARGVEIRLRIYGAGPEESSLRGLAGSFGLEEAVCFEGALSPASALRTALKEADLFAMPHLTHDFGRAFFDAMAAGLPVVAFRSVASQDTVRDGVDGLLVANADPEALANGLARCHKERGALTLMSDNARQRALENTKGFWNGYRAQLIHELFSSNA